MNLNYHTIKAILRLIASEATEVREKGIEDLRDEINGYILPMDLHQWYSEAVTEGRKTHAKEYAFLRSLDYARHRALINKRLDELEIPIFDQADEDMRRKAMSWLFNDPRLLQQAESMPEVVKVVADAVTRIFDDFPGTDPFEESFQNDSCDQA